MKILALDLSSPRGSIASAEDGRESFEQQFANDRKHSGAFFDALQVFIKRFGKPDPIIVGLGPGSYAGTRIAIATAIGLEAAGRARLLGVASVCGIRTEAEEYAVVGDARRETFYFTRVRRRQCVEGPLLCTRAELAQRVEAVDYPVFASEAIAPAPEAVIAFPSALVLAHLDVNALSPEPLEPIYLREPHITLPHRMPSRLPTAK